MFNRALALQKQRYRQGEKRLGYAALCRLLTTWRHSSETAWLADAPTHPLQQALKDLERAYTNFFAKRARFPRFKKKGRSENFRYPDPKQIQLDQVNSHLFLPKLGWLRFRPSRLVLGTVKQVTVSRLCGKWLVSMQTEREVERPLPQGEAVGIDLGIARFATLSDGTFYPPLDSFIRHQQALRKGQQALSRKKKRSRNWIKAKARLQRLYVRIRRARGDFLHKLTTPLSKNHARVCVEDLKVGPMSRSAAGTREAPGTNVGAKSSLNRSTQARFECVVCGFQAHADWVGAINILRAGQARIACEVSGATMPPAEEPTEAIRSSVRLESAP